MEATYATSIKPAKIEDMNDAFFKGVKEASDKYWGKDFEPTMMLPHHLSDHIEILRPIAAAHKIKLVKDPYHG